MAQELILIPKVKYDILNSRQQETQNPQIKEADRDSNQISNHKNLWDALQYVIPLKLHRKARGLINYIVHNGKNLLNWDDADQLIYKGKSLQGSNVIYLITHALSPHTSARPIGYEEFHSALKDINTPTSLISNEKRETMASTDNHQEGMGLVVKKRTDGAPPGLQRPRKKPKTTTMKWINF